MAIQQNVAAREKHRRSNGEFGTQPLDEASIGPDGVDLRATRDRAIEQIDGSDITAGDLLIVDGEDRVVDRAYPISSPEDGRHGGEWIVEFESYDREPGVIAIASIRSCETPDASVGSGSRPTDASRRGRVGSRRDDEDGDRPPRRPRHVAGPRRGARAGR